MGSEEQIPVCKSGHDLTEKDGSAEEFQCKKVIYRMEVIGYFMF